MASIMAREFFEMGILKSDRPVIVNLGERIASPNHSWVHNLFEIEGRDRLVFIDEVESAVKSATGGWGEENAGGGDSHLSSSLQIFVTKLLSVTTDNDCDTIVCLAGYKRGVDRLLRLDSGLSSRFPTTFTLKGYDGSVLKEILKAYLNKNYQQIVDIDAENMLPALIDDLRASLKHEDMEGWANGRTAETIAEKVHSLKPDKTVLTMDDFAEVTIQIGSNEYKLRNYIGLSGGNPLDDLRRIAGTEKIVEYLEKLQKRYESKVKLPTRMNIAILSAGATYDIDRVLMPIARFLARINAITRPSVTHFDYGATLSFYQNRPTMLTEQQFDMAEGSLLVFDQPSRYFDNIEKNRYTEQTTAIQSRASLISNTDSDTVMVVLETVEGWDEMEDPSRFPDFTSLFTPFEFSVKDRSGAIQILELRLRDMNFELSPEFIAELSADHDIISPDLIDPTVDLLLDNASLKMNEKGDKMVLTADEAHFFFGGGLW